LWLQTLSDWKPPEVLKGRRFERPKLRDRSSPARSVQIACHVHLAEKMRWRLKRSTRKLCEVSDFAKARWPELSVMTERDETIDA